MEQFKPHSEEVLPARPLVLWHYTDLTDPRYTIAKEYISLNVDERYGEPQKIGAGNKQGWLGYRVGEYAFVKLFEHEQGEYPDMGSNCEIYTGGSFVELESLSTLKTVAPNDSVTHDERWILRKVDQWPTDSAEILNVFNHIISSAIK